MVSNLYFFLVKSAVFNIRLSTFSVPSGSRAMIFEVARKPKFKDGLMVGMGWMDGISKVSFNFLWIFYVPWISRYYTDSDVFLADSVDLPDISDFFADILTFFHDGWEN